MGLKLKKIMAKFESAFKLTSQAEGGYSFNPDDTGKETYRGVSRKNWPNWQGWSHIDTIKENHGTDAHTINQWGAKVVVLQSLVANFYRVNFWDVNKLDQFNDQQLANTVYDFGVNSGTDRAAKTLQQCLSIPADGIVGPQTINAVNAAKEPDLYNQYNEMRRLFYENLATHPGQHQFLASWLSRLKPYV